MNFAPFQAADFSSMEKVGPDSIPKQLEDKIDALRQALGAFPEFRPDVFPRLVRRKVRPADDGVVFRRAKSEEQHWYFYNRGGDQDQVQLNVGMFPDYIRVGLGFQIGRQVSPKIPAFHVLQSLLGARPPLPFRDAFYQCIGRNKFGIEGQPRLRDAESITQRLEVFHIPSDDSPVFVFVGALWDPAEASKKRADDYRKVFDELLPFYEALILTAGRLEWNDWFVPSG
jgi:hypothetical protein